MTVDRVTIPLLRADVLRYEAEAETKGLPLEQYLVDRIRREDVFEAELEAVRRATRLDLIARAQKTPEIGQYPSGALGEILLLLRELAGRRRAENAQAEVHRRGLETWK